MIILLEDTLFSIQKQCCTFRLVLFYTANQCHILSQKEIANSQLVKKFDLGNIFYGFDTIFITYRT